MVYDVMAYPVLFKQLRNFELYYWKVPYLRNLIAFSSYFPNSACYEGQPVGLEAGMGAVYFFQELRLTLQLRDFKLYYPKVTCLRNFNPFSSYFPNPACFEGQPEPGYISPPC